MPDVPSLVPRDSSSSSKISTSTIIIIAVVAASVVALAFALFAWRFFARQFRRSTIPLPPPQDLAHHREQQLSSFADRAPRPTTWLDPLPYHQKPRAYSHFLSASGSSASLIRSSPDISVSRGPTRESSWAVDSLEGSPFPTPSTTEDLLPPNPAFLPVSNNPHASMASVVSSSSDGISDVNAVLVPTSPSDVSHSVESSASVMVTPARSRPPRASRSRQRPTSVVSSSGTMHSVQTSHSTSGNTLRGPAHSIHSNIQIVLPTPLAPQLYAPPEGVERSYSFYSAAGDRRSMADPWVVVGSRQSSRPSSSNGSPSNSYAGSRPPYQRSRSNLSATSSTSAGNVRRAQSQSAAFSAEDSRPPVPSSGHARSSSVPQQMEMMPPPAVPPVPSVYMSASSDTVTAADAYPTPPTSFPGDHIARGRPREAARPSEPASGASATGAVPVGPPSAYSMPLSGSGSSGKLRKSRSKSQTAAARKSAVS
ncbi:hypothetical protein DICSQDRAFT_130782 [Dichomitus squalens LYAD-421 SS1]|uniref:uncharacterized protein n=1 Tax=Dichomitus squalens (strain LYAD-421) TaxID=732165 RepID=UPI0004412271|nr:uncharacterized protein DICSQDRAFT_130782 [Dichomitus squalens LYAD-421 SS1]EJF66525.1 hypothetical protein DICSQDRAFT_130782 [Dichomitus squalens LYAD-421 SS1]